jgi:hypothetical protein
MSVDMGIETQLDVGISEVRHRLAVVFRILIESSIQNSISDHRKDILHGKTEKQVDGANSTSIERGNQDIKS